MIMSTLYLRLCLDMHGLLLVALRQYIPPVIKIPVQMYAETGNVDLASHSNIAYGSITQEDTLLDWVDCVGYRTPARALISYRSLLGSECPGEETNASPIP